MKNIIIGLLVIGSLSISAGTIENKNSGETIQFQLNRTNQVLTIISNTAMVENKNVSLKYIHGDNYVTNVFSGTSGALKLSKDSEFVVGVYLVLPAIVAYDLVLMPFKSSIKLIQNMQNKKDLNKLMKAISTDETVSVSSNRFRRISELL